MRIKASTVFGVGSRMSISRLCVRISKCSRESLYLCGERMTQYTFFSVGSGNLMANAAQVNDQSLLVLSLLNELVNSAKISSDIPVTQQLQVLP